MEERNNKEDLSFISVVGVGAQGEYEGTQSHEIVEFQNFVGKFRRRRKLGVLWKGVGRLLLAFSFKSCNTSIGSSKLFG